MKYIKYSQKQTFYCSVKLALLSFFFLGLYGFIVSYMALPIPGFSILVPLVLGILLIPLQALLFDWFQANTKSLEINNEKLLYRYSPNVLYTDEDETQIYDLKDLRSIEIRFEGLACLQTMILKFTNGKKLTLMGFYLDAKDFSLIKAAVSKFSFGKYDE
jgi:hypothetical protein